MIFKNKGQITPSIFFGLIGVIILIISFGIIFATSQKSYAIIRDTVSENKVATISNEKLTFVNNSASGLAQSWLVAGTAVVIASCNGIQCTNLTLNQGRNYTTNSNEDGSSIIPINETSRDWYNNSVFWANYSYYYGSSERNITKSGQAGLRTMQEFQPTWAIVIAAFIIIILIISLVTIFWNKFNF